MTPGSKVPLARYPRRRRFSRAAQAAAPRGHDRVLLRAALPRPRVSVAGEATAIQVPELDIGFDVGQCPRFLLPSKYLAISHGHMDHTGGLAYFCSQCRFQGMGNGRIVCDGRIAPDIRKMMDGFVDLERQKTPYDLIPLKPEDQVEIKNNFFLRGSVCRPNIPVRPSAIPSLRSGASSRPSTSTCRRRNSASSRTAALT